MPSVECQYMKDRLSDMKYLPERIQPTSFVVARTVAASTRTRGAIITSIAQAQATLHC